MRTALLLCLAACGSPFTSATSPEGGIRHEAGEAGEAPETGSDVRVGHHPHEAGLPETAPPVDTGTDTSAPVDSGHDSGHEDDAGCTDMPPMTDVTWCSPIPAAYCIVNTTGGVTDYPGVTPAGCRCASTYTCACVEAMTDPCGGHGAFVSCSYQAGPPGPLRVICH